MTKKQILEKLEGVGANDEVLALTKVRQYSCGGWEYTTVIKNIDDIRIKPKQKRSPKNETKDAAKLMKLLKDTVAKIAKLTGAKITLDVQETEKHDD